MKRVAPVSIHLLWALLLTVTGTYGQTDKIASDLKVADLKTTAQLIIQFDKDPTDAYHQKILSRGGTLKTTLHSLKAGVYSLPASAVAELANDASVVHISQDHRIFAKLDYTASAVNAPLAWQSGWTGAGIGVALLDSGMSPDQDITDRNIVHQQNLIPGEASGSVYDRYGHGMHVAGIIASNGASSSCSNCTRSLKGIAPGASLINLRVLDENGESTDSAVIAGIETAIQLKDKYNIRVMNLSLGRPIFESYKTDPLCQAVEAAWKAGIVVVVAAGNEGRENPHHDGYGTITAPGNDPYVITVGAMKTMGTFERSDDLIASYSSKGPTEIDNIVKPDLVAPGNRVVSILAPGSPTLQKQAGAQALVPYSYYENPPEKGMSDRYLVLSGTSMAAGVVTGAVADLLQEQPNLTPDQVKVLLMKTAYKAFPQSSVATDPVTGLSYTSYYDVFTRGSGYLDLGAALQSKQTPPAGDALSPVVSYNNLTDKPYLVFDQASLWNSTGRSQEFDWTPRVTWGMASVDADRSLWSDWGAWSARTIWSAATMNAERSLWSESTIPIMAQSDNTSVLLTGEP